MSNEPHITPRVAEALFYRVVMGLSRKETALIMGISPFTVRAHERKAEEEFGARNWHQLGSLVIATGFFDGATVLEINSMEYPQVWSLVDQATN